MDTQGLSQPLIAAKARPPVYRPRRRSDSPSLSIVVVNYRHWDDTSKLVRQLRSSAPLKRGSAEVVIVDNHSPYHPVIGKLRRLSGVSLRRWRHNRGFARAVNEGCRLSRGDWFLLLNPDVTLNPGFLDGVLRTADRLTVEQPDVGVVGFRLRNSDGSRQLSTGRFPNLARTLGGLLLPRAQRKYHSVSATESSRVDWVTGCCLLVRRRCWEQLGGLDTDFFLYYEDVDLCARATQCGWQVVHEPALAVTHHHPLHSRDVSAALRLITRHALMTYASKHWPAASRRMLSSIVGWEAWFREKWARFRGEKTAARVFSVLRRIVVDFDNGSAASACKRLVRFLRREEQAHAPAVGHYSQL
jgi:N-acetylglucosaminyl-diphospho-decaprenol L-rhamnosyltransferase